MDGWHESKYCLSGINPLLAILEHLDIFKTHGIYWLMIMYTTHYQMKECLLSRGKKKHDSAVFQSL